MRAGADWAWWADTNCEVLSVWPGDSQCSKQINYFVYTRHGGVMQSRDQEQWAGPKLSNGCQPFGPVSTNYSSISGERQSASGKATRGMSWIIISLHPDLANITLLSAQTAGSNTGDWNVGGDPRWCPPPPPTCNTTNTANPSTLTWVKWFYLPRQDYPSPQTCQSTPHQYSVSQPVMDQRLVSPEPHDNVLTLICLLGNDMQPRSQTPSITAGQIAVQW